MLAGAVPSGGFFSGKKASKNQMMRIYYNIGVFVRFCKKNLVVYHDLDHDKQHLLDWHLRGKTFFGKSSFLYDKTS